MNNTDLNDALEELFHHQAVISSELDYYTDEEGNTVVTHGWTDVLDLLQRIEELSPYLELISNIMEEAEELGP